MNEKSKRFLDMLDDSLSREEFKKAFEAVMRQILEIEKKLTIRIDNKLSSAMSSLVDIENTHREVIKRIEQENSTSFSNMKKWAIEQVTNLFVKYQIKEKMVELDRKMSEVKDGKDADEEKIVEKVLAQIKLPEYKETVLDNAEQIVSKLETLKGNKRLDKSAISGLEDEIKGLREQISNIPRGGGGGSRKTTYIKRIDLTSQCNGVLKSFAVPKDTIAIIGVFGTQFPITFDTADFTLLGNTLILTSEVSAPAVGQTLFALVETLFY